MRKNIANRLIVLLALCSLFFTPVSPALAQSNIDVQANRADLDFPNKLTFVLEAKSSSPINKVTLEYGTNGRTCVKGTARQQVDITPGTSVSASWEWDWKDSGSLPPGAEVWWKWEVTDQAGNKLVTDMSTLTIEDNRLDWNTVSTDQVTVVWSEGSRSFGQELLDIATKSLDMLQTQAGIRPPGKVRLTIFPSYDALRAAGLFLPEWTGGVASPEYNSTMIGMPATPSDSWLNEVIPHELAHLVTGTLTFNCLGANMPTWLSEGFSVYAEGGSSSKDLQNMNDALQGGTLPPLHNLEAGFSANSDEAVLSYTQSGEVVSFMIKTYGRDKIGALLAAIQSGKTIDPALQQVYGFDTDGLDSAWRESLGFAPVASGQQGTATPVAKRTAVPTLALWTSSFGQSGESPAATDTPPAVAEVQPTTTPTQESQLRPTSSAGSIASTALPTSVPPKSKSPISCLGGNLLVAGVLASISIYFYLIRRFYN